MKIWVTDNKRGMQEGTAVPVVAGKAEFTVDATSFTSLTSVM